MKTKIKDTGIIKQLIPMKDMLEESDLTLIKRRNKIKAELKALDSQLKPRIKNTVKHFGACVVIVGGTQVILSQLTRQSVSWKACAYAVATIEEVESIADEFTVESISYKAEIA